MPIVPSGREPGPNHPVMPDGVFPVDYEIPGTGRRRLRTKTDKPKYPGRLCFCNYEFCPNSTCEAKPDAACYHTIKYNRNALGAWDRSEGDHEFGCFPPEAGGSAMQCHAHLIPSRRPTTVSCCFNGDYCNTELTPPEAIFDPNDITPPSLNMALILGLGIPIGLLICLIIFMVLCLIRKRNQHRKWSYESEFDVTDITEKKHNPWLPKVFWPLLHDSEKERLDPSCLDSWNAVKKELDADISSGSGSGIPHLVQRTVARQLTQGELIGQGRYGAVRKSWYKNDLVAVKTFLTTEEASWRNEAEIYNTPQLRHENILGFIASDIRGGSRTEMLLIMDYCPLGSLYDYLKRDTPLSLEEAVSLSLTAIKGIEHLHDEIVGTQMDSTRGKPQIAHRDIKSKNILVKRKGVCAIADFGLAIKYSRDMQTPEIPKNHRVGTIRYMAPEILNNTIQSNVFDSFKRVDMYAYGLVLWEITRRIQDEPACCYTGPQGVYPMVVPSLSLSVETEEESLSTESGTPVRFSSPNPSPASPPLPNLPLIRLAVTKRSDVLSDDSGVSNGTDGSGTSSGVSGVLQHRPLPPLHQRVPSTTAKKYLSPYEDLAPSDPAFERMREIVCVEKRRPSIEESWDKKDTTRKMAKLMKECWSERPDSRVTASYVKKQLKIQLEKCSPENS